MVFNWRRTSPIRWRRMWTCRRSICGPALLGVLPLGHSRKLRQCGHQMEVASRTGSSDTGMEVKLTTGLEKERIIAQRPVSRLSMGGGLVSPTSWARNGKYVVTRIDGTGQAPSYLGLFNIDEQKLSRMLGSKANEANGQISPDGNWLAYASDESGGWNIYVTTFPSAAGKWQVSVGGGTEPRWRDDGKRNVLPRYERCPRQQCQSSRARGFPAVPRSRSSACARRAPISNTDVFSYDVTKDGSRFIVNRYVKPSFVPPLGILLNATASVRETPD